MQTQTDKSNQVKSPANTGLGSSATQGATDLTMISYERIESLFISLKLKPGSTLRTQDLQAMTGLGRTPVHQAVHRLSAETLFETRPRIGLRVAPIDLDREKRLSLLHRDMDRFVIAAATNGMESNDRARLGHMIRVIERDFDIMTLDKFNIYDKAFDMLLMQASGERFLERSLLPLKALARRSGYLEISQISGQSGLEDSMNRHLDIMRAIMEGDVEKSCSMSDKLVDLRVEMLNHLEKQIDPEMLDVNFKLSEDIVNH